MPNQINSKNTPKTYDAGEMADVYSLAESDMQWMSVAIKDIRKRLKEIKTKLGNNNVLGFYDLEHVVDMYQYIAENRLHHYSDETEAYQAEWEKMKGGSHNA
ncbi:hypothetical protein ABTP92_11835 [Acinetobacter baumannii]|uniref:hypothetical protein n=1 Tax=Acinetobacter calcoaceticus/baumannii complex TaxID=909768 RepID=UPI0002985480|nr:MULTISPECIES: hypothetical protein [Acinetobacter calcoaceticus/baumannii complex]EHU1907198.1 hypothetical protein [Acinetobacter baumannii]EKP55129.1 hypothetical protein ACINNAV82_0993 [Acinetobacter baumannii Naval-82]EKW2153971.1 hypothetical protein [Acinetobacter baumannii]EXE77201.1 hypothetical protein J583_2338 [Acinetobacter baumannii 83444]KQE77160.1 hypothetical protein APB90_08680 [Acinetobacter baumannii]